MRNLFNAFMTLAAIGMSFSAFGQHLPMREERVKLPESYFSFFPQKETGETKKKLQAKASESLSGPVYGYLYFSTDASRESGFYHIDPSTATDALEWIDYYTDWGMVMTNGWLRDGKVCGMNSFTFMGGILSYNYVELDFETGEALKLVPLKIDNNDLRNVYVTAAYRDMDDHIYGYGYSNDGESMGYNCAPATDIDASETLRITPIEEVCTSLCYSSQTDLLYGVTTEGVFVSIQPETGIQTPIFTLNIPNLRDAVTGMVYSPSDNTFIWNAYFTNNTSAFYSIDPEKKTVIRLASCPSGEEYNFMVTLEDAAPQAPAKAMITGFAFEKASTSGKVNATLPVKDNAGNQLAGNLTWRLYADGEQLSSGSAAPGALIEAEAIGLTAGNHVFAVVTESGNYRSAPAIESQWIGADYPAAPQNVVLKDTNVSWDAVTVGAHGGYIDIDDLVYTVYLNDIKAGDTKSTTLDITYPAGEPYQTYYAYVVASASGNNSEEGISNPINYGDALKINPSIHYRPEEWELPLFTTYNADGKTDSNGNDLTWRYTEEMGFPSFASGYDGDDWLFFPPMLFDNTEKAYKFVMEAGIVHDSDTRGRISVFLGKEPTPEAMTQTILPSHQCEYMRGDDILEYFSVSEPGVYYIGIRAITYTVSFHISDMDIAITDRSALLPMAVSNLTAVAGADGQLTATVTFTMPTHSTNGQPIAEDANLKAIISSNEREEGSSQPGELTEQKTISGKPGSTQTVQIRTAQNNNLITVACSLDGNVGAPASMYLYTGVVRPYIVQDLKSEVTKDNMGMKLTWNPPVEGEEEGAIGNDFYYTVWYYNDGWEFGDHVGWNIREYTYTLPQGAEQQWIRLGIMALNDAGQSYHISSVTSVIGTPYELPMVETFPDYYEEYEPIMVQRPSAAYENTYWMVDDPADVLGREFANASGVAYIGFVDPDGPEIVNAKSRLSLPKFSTKDLSGVTFTLDYFGGLNGNYAASFNILANIYGESEIELAALPKGEGWISHTLTLPEKLSNRDWVEILIDNEYATNQQFAMFSAYEISYDSHVGSVSEDVEGNIWTSGSTINIAGFRGKQLLISDMNGKTVVKREALSDINGFAVAPGVYVVKAGNTTAKVIVK